MYQGPWSTAIFYGRFRDTAEFKEIIIRLYRSFKDQFRDSAEIAVDQGPCRDVRSAAQHTYITQLCYECIRRQRRARYAKTTHMLQFTIENERGGFARSHSASQDVSAP